MQSPLPRPSSSSAPAARSPAPRRRPTTTSATSPAPSASTRSSPRRPALRDVPVETEQIAQLDSKDMDFATWQRARAAGRPPCGAARGRRASSSPMAPTRSRRRRTSSPASCALAQAGGADRGDAAGDLARGRRAAQPRRRDRRRRRGRARRRRRRLRRHAAFGARRAQGPFVAARRVLVRRRRAARPRSRPAGSRSADPGRRSPPSASSSFRRPARPGRGSRSSPAAPASMAAPSRALVAAGVDGLVVAATGNGSIHREIAAALERGGRARPIPVLRATRCLDGGVAEKAELRASPRPATSRR